MFNKFKSLILIAIIFSLFLPSPASAILGTGLFDAFDTMKGGIEELTVNMVKILLVIFFLYAAGLGALNLSTRFLESFIEQQTSWLLQLEPMTRLGWNFTAGLANMALIIIFLIIIFAFIFKIETFQAKKALPALIGIALLLNFSLLFVHILVDISQIVYKTILDALPPGGIFSKTMGVLMEPSLAIVGQVIALIVALAGAFAIPIGSAFAQVIFTGLFTALFLPNLIIWVIQAIFFWNMAIMFFIFAILFGARVFVIQLLAILSPLAFICLILPQTKKLWSYWLNTLIEWLLLGIVFLFFLGLGFSVLELLKPKVWAPAAILPGVLWGSIGALIIYYFVLLIYMGIILYIGKKFIPKGAEGVVSFAEGAAKTLITGGIKPAAAGLAGMAKKRAYRSQAHREEKRGEALKEAAEGMEAGEEKGLTFKQRLKTGIWTRRKVSKEMLDEKRERAEAREKRLKETAMAEEMKKIEGWDPARQNDELLGQEKAIIKNPERIAAIVQKQAEKGRISPVAEKLIKEAVRGGADLDLILDRRPDLAPQFGKSITEEMAKRSPEYLREEMQVEALKNIEVVYRIVKDESTLNEFRDKASTGARQQIKETFFKEGFPKEDQALMKQRVNELSTDPKWFGMKTEEEKKEEKTAPGPSVNESIEKNKPIEENESIEEKGYRKEYRPE